MNAWAWGDPELKASRAGIPMNKKTSAICVRSVYTLKKALGRVGAEYSSSPSEAKGLVGAKYSYDTRDLGGGGSENLGGPSKKVG